MCRVARTRPRATLTRIDAPWSVDRAGESAAQFVSVFEMDGTMMIPSRWVLPRREIPRVEGGSAGFCHRRLLIAPLRIIKPRVTRSFLPEGSHRLRRQLDPEDQGEVAV